MLLRFSIPRPGPGLCDDGGLLLLWAFLLRVIAVFADGVGLMVPRERKSTIGRQPPTLCCAIVLPGRKSGFRAGFDRILVGKTSKSALRPAGGFPD